MRRLSRQSSDAIVKISILSLALVFLGSLVSPKISFQSMMVNGQTQPAFGTPFDLSQIGVNATNPDIWNVGSHVYVIWNIQNATGLDFRASPDGGATWTPPLSSPPLNLAPKGSAAAPLLSANGSNVYVVWTQNVNGVFQIFEATSINYGQSFNWVTQITYSNSTANITPVIASWGNNVYLAWSAGTYSFVSCSNNSGAPGSWTQPYNYANQHEPEIAAWGGQYVYAVSDAGLVVSSDNCNTWRSMSGLHPWGAEAWVAASGPNAYATWESKGNTSVVYYSYSNNYGANWTMPTVLTSTFNNAWSPMLGAYNNSAWIAIHTNPGSAKSQVYIYTSNNAGATWSSPIALSQNPRLGSDTGFPFTVTSSDGQNVFVAWPQQVSLGTWQFFASYSPNGGLSWTQLPGTDVSQNPVGTQASNNNDVANGAIASFGANCYAVWQYVVGSTNQVYFASTLYNPPSSTSTTTTNGTPSSIVSTTSSSTRNSSMTSATIQTASSRTTSLFTIASSSSSSTTKSVASFGSSTSTSSGEGAPQSTIGGGMADNTFLLYDGRVDLVLAFGMIASSSLIAFGMIRKDMKTRESER
jgi:hypothetical protein